MSTPSCRIVWALRRVVLPAVFALVLAPPAAASPDPCPPAAYDPGDPAPSPERIATLRRGEFSILDRPAVRLVPPVSWNQDPYRSKSWRSKLHEAQWLDPLLTAYSRRRDVAALRQARDLMLDWIRSNPAYGAWGWRNKVSGNRAEVLGYVVAASQCAGILTPAQRSALRNSAIEHGKYLSNPGNYDPGNHGVFMDRGLLLLSGFLPSLPGAGAWHNLAVRRFRTGLPIDPVEAVDLEHTPGYQYLVLDLVQHVLAYPFNRDRALVSIARRLRAAAGWFVMPDRYVTRLGDTSYRRAPGNSLTGIAPTWRRSGFGIVKLPRSYLSVASGYHRFGHKQADELTFELYDRGRRIVTDTGRYGYTRDPDDPAKVAGLAFTKSSQAHSVLVVDGVSFPFEQSRPYGSGIVATGSGAGWWAIQGTNPLVAKQGVSHQRLFLYRPGQALVVVDQVTARVSHDYTRYFQFDPRIAVTGTGDGRTFLLRAPRFFGSVYSAPTGGDREASVVVGQRDPLLGFTTSSDRFAQFVPRAAVTYATRADSASYVTVLSLSGRATATLLRSAPASVAVRLVRGGRGPVTISAVRSGSRLRISATG